MKFINMLKGVITIVLFFSMLFSCTKKFDKLNTDPNLITQDVVKINGLLTQVLANSANDGGARISEFINFTNPGMGIDHMPGLIMKVIIMGIIKAS